MKTHNIFIFIKTYINLKKQVSKMQTDGFYKKWGNLTSYPFRPNN